MKKLFALAFLCTNINVWSMLNSDKPKDSLFPTLQVTKKELYDFELLKKRINDITSKEGYSYPALIKFIELKTPHDPSIISIFGSLRFALKHVSTSNSLSELTLSNLNGKQFEESLIYYAPSNSSKTPVAEEPLALYLRLEVLKSVLVTHTPFGSQRTALSQFTKRKVDQLNADERKRGITIELIEDTNNEN